MGYDGNKFSRGPGWSYSKNTRLAVASSAYRRRILACPTSSFRPLRRRSAAPRRSTSSKRARASMKELLGGKGAGLAEMTRAGLPVPPGFIDHDRAVPGASTRRAGSFPDGSATGDSRTRCASSRRRTGKRFGADEQPVARLRSQRRARLDARHDGHDPQPRAQRPRPSRALAELTGNDALRVRRVPPLHHDVLERRARDREGALRASARGREEAARASRPIRELERGRLEGADPAVSRGSSSAKPSASFRRTSSSSSISRSARSSIRGTPSARSTTAATTRCPTIGAPPSASSRWYSATWATIREPASRSRAIRTPGAQEALRRVPAQRAG